MLTTDDICLIVTTITCYVKVNANGSKSSKNLSKWMKNWLVKRYTYSRINLLNDLCLDLRPIPCIYYISRYSNKSR